MVHYRRITETSGEGLGKGNMIPEAGPWKICEQPVDKRKRIIDFGEHARIT